MATTAPAPAKPASPAPPAQGAVTPADQPLTQGLAAFYASTRPPAGKIFDYPALDLGGPGAPPKGIQQPSGWTGIYQYRGPGIKGVAILCYDPSTGTGKPHVRLWSPWRFQIVAGPHEGAVIAPYLSAGQLVTLGCYDEWAALGKPPVIVCEHDGTGGNALWDSIREPLEIAGIAVATIVSVGTVLPLLAAGGSALAGAAPAIVAAAAAGANAVAVLPFQAVAGLVVGGGEIAGLALAPDLAAAGVGAGGAGGAGAAAGGAAFVAAPGVAAAGAGGAAAAGGAAVAAAAPAAAGFLGLGAIGDVAATTIVTSAVGAGVGAITGGTKGAEAGAIAGAATGLSSGLGSLGLGASTTQVAQGIVATAAKAGAAAAAPAPPSPTSVNTAPAVATSSPSLWSKIPKAVKVGAGVVGALVLGVAIFLGAKR